MAVSVSREGNSVTCRQGSNDTYIRPPPSLHIYSSRDYPHYVDLSIGTDPNSCKHSKLHIPWVLLNYKPNLYDLILRPPTCHTGSDRLSTVCIKYQLTATATVRRYRSSTKYYLTPLIADIPPANYKAPKSSIIDQDIPLAEVPAPPSPYRDFNRLIETFFRKIMSDRWLVVRIRSHGRSCIRQSYPQHAS